MKWTTRIRRELERARRRGCEVMGSARFSRPSLHGIDAKLERFLDHDGGFFAEAGANDGYAQSNTYYFEKMRGWRGVLIEPIPTLAAECRRNRSAFVVEAALVSRDLPGNTVEIHYAGLMSTVAGALGPGEATRRHVELGLAVQQIAEPATFRVPARTLSSLLDELGLDRRIDLLSLDVEGSEPAALEGIDYTRHAPRFICVEARDEAAILRVLEPRYRLVEALTDLGTHRDLLFALR